MLQATGRGMQTEHQGHVMNKSNKTRDPAQHPCHKTQMSPEWTESRLHIVAGCTSLVTRSTYQSPCTWCSQCKRPTRTIPAGRANVGTYRELATCLCRSAARRRCGQCGFGPRERPVRATLRPWAAVRPSWPRECAPTVGQWQRPARLQVHH
jgi:hypothetical protein